MATKRKKQTVWVIMHYEYLFDDKIDGLQFHVSSSRRRAEAYIAKVLVDSHSWWQVYPYVVDDTSWLNEGREVYYYSHTGKPIKSPPYKRALAAYQRHKEMIRELELEQKQEPQSE